MVAAHKSPQLTPEEYFAWEEQQEQRHEYFDGEVFAMAGGTIPHGIIALNVATLLRSQVRSKGCLVLNSDCRVGISENGPFTYPDISVSCSERDRTAQKFVQDPCLIVEVLSPSTEAYDRGGKFALYRQIRSLNTYLLISSETRCVEVFHRGEQGEWRFTPYDDNGLIQLPDLGITLDFEQIYEDIVFPEPQESP